MRNRVKVQKAWSLHWPGGSPDAINKRKPSRPTGCRVTPRPTQSTLKLFATVMGAPENAGTFAALKWRSAHLPAAVPPKGPSTS